MTKALSFGVSMALALAAASAQATPPADARAERDASGNLVVSWADDNPVDIFVSNSPDAAFARTGVISAKDRDGREAVPDAGTQRRYFILRDTRTGDQTRVAERVLTLDQGSNFRDIGGYATSTGRRIKWGKIYRSGATPLLTDRDVDQIKSLGIVDMIDLRSSEERVLAPTRLNGIRYTAIDYSMMSMMPTSRVAGSADMTALYHRMPSFLAPHLRIVFDDLLGAKGPILYHCSAGQDRTGVTSAIILAALGVPRDTIIGDYHLSTTYRRPQYEMPPISPALIETNPVAKMFAMYQKAPNASTPNPLKEADGKAFLLGALDEIDTRWGSVDAFLMKEIGLTKTDLARLRATYTE